MHVVYVRKVWVVDEGAAFHDEKERKEKNKKNKKKSKKNRG